MDLLMALRGSKHGMTLFPPVPSVNMSDAGLLHDKVKSQLYSWVSVCALCPSGSVVNFSLPSENFPLFVGFGFVCWFFFFFFSDSRKYLIREVWVGKKPTCESSFPMWWDGQPTSETIWIKTALKILSYFCNCLICGATKCVFLRDCICCFIEKAVWHH